MSDRNIFVKIAEEVGAKAAQVAAAVALLDEGATVPFIARYRKEVTGGLDDTQLRNLSERLLYLRELEERRGAIIASISEQGKMEDALLQKLEAAETKQVLEDLYVPYKPKRRTKAQMAREAGIAPLAEALLYEPLIEPEAEAAKFLNPEAGFADIKAVLEGARHIVMELFSENAELLGALRQKMQEEALVRSKIESGKEEAALKFSDYFDYQEAWRDIPSHRALALFRGRNEGFLSLSLLMPWELEEAKPLPTWNACEAKIAHAFAIPQGGAPADKWRFDAVRLAWRVKLFSQLELELMSTLRERAEEVAISVFGQNLKDLLLASPAGARATMGLDPGLRTGVKVAVVDETGKVLDTTTIFPHEPRRDWEGSKHTLAALCARHKVALVSIGNGTASRETDRLVADLTSDFPQLKLTRIIVSEAGASVYSASEYAAREFPELDVSLRGAVSIARRLQDPLAELVKIDPQSIGVGQYQHDVSQSRLSRTLDAVVEDCVNAVGVDVNTASSALLARVSGLNATLAANIVAYRDQAGAFATRTALKKVPRLGEKTFEQAAGFLRITSGKNPLDASSVHPESYPVVEKILSDLQKKVSEVLGDKAIISCINPQKYVSDEVGLPTLLDILKELEKPGRDPRPEFKTASFKEGVESIKDLKEGMLLEGVITNVANFGAFVDVGVHQDGLVHISALSDKFVKDPREVVKAGDIVRVKVMEVDVKRARIALSLRLTDAPSDTPKKMGGAPMSPKAKLQAARQTIPENAMSAAFAKLKG